MKEPNLYSGVDCTNLRTREGYKVLEVKRGRKNGLGMYPFLVLVDSVGGGEWLSFVSTGHYWVDKVESPKDIIELEGGDKGYIGGGLNEKFN